MSKLIGNKYEKIALAFLVKQGLTKLTLNYQTRYGEIDLIMLEGDKIIFVEVRKRRSINDALESLTTHKILKLMTVASEYISEELGYDLDCRFDVIGIDDKGTIEWVRDVIAG